MDDILKSILQGAAQQQVGGRQQAKPQQSDLMGEVLKGILGGGASAPAQQPQQGGDMMGEILKGILGGGATPQPQRQEQAPAGGMGINDILGSILGGSQRGGSTQGGGLADLIGTIIGGGGASGMGGGNDMGILGGAAVNPIAQILAKRLGISPQMAQMAVMFFMSYFMRRMAQPRAQQQPSQDQYNIGRAKPQGKSADLDDLLDIMDDSTAVESRFADSGMAQELAKASGMDPQTANRTLQEILKIVGEQRQAPRMQPAESNLKGLLDQWD